MKQKIEIDVPENKQAELDVLSALVKMPLDLQEKFIRKLNPECFYSYDNNVLFQAIQKTAKERRFVPNYRYEEAYISMGKDPALGALQYLKQVNYSPAELEKIIEDLHTYRRMRHNQNLLINNTKPSNLAPQFLLKLGQAFIRVADQSKESSLIDAFDAVRAQQQWNLDHIGADDLRVSTGFNCIDMQLDGGLKPKTLTLLAARPSTGKTTLGCNILQNIAMNPNTIKPSLMFSAEMSIDRLADDFLSRFCHFPTGHLTDLDAKRALQGRELARSIAQLQPIDGVPRMMISDNVGTAQTIVSTATKAAEQYGGLSFILIDHAQLLKSGGDNFQTRSLEIGEIAKSFVDMAKELNCPVMLISQLNRSIETDKERKPQNSDLRDSGDLEQDADTIIFMKRLVRDNAEETMLYFTKNRRGRCGEVPLVFMGEHMCFYEVGQAIPRFDHELSVRYGG